MGKTYGYCRISTPHQSIERQARNILREYPDAVLFEEVYTGTKLERPKFQLLLRRIHAGDTIVFDEVSRMSRDAEEGFALYEELYAKGVNLVFLKEPHINTDTYRKSMNTQIEMTGEKVDMILEGVNKYLMALAKEQIRLAFAQSQKEVDFLHQRTSDGIREASDRGKQIGRPKGSRLITKKGREAKAAIIKYSKDFSGMMKDVEIMKMQKKKKNQYYVWKRQLRNETVARQ